MSRLKMAVVGLHFGKTLIQREIIEGYGKEYFELVGVCDLNEALRASAAQQYGCSAYANLAEVLADDAIDLVALLTGPNGRAKLIDSILDAGKGVMTTKPFETSSTEALRVLQKARKLDIPVFLNSPEAVASRDIVQLQRWREEYGLGRLVGYQAHTWSSYREKPTGDWYDDPKLCPAAPILRLGTYCVGFLSWFLPEVETAQVLTSRIFTERPTADNAIMNILHTDGTLGSLYASFCVNDGQRGRYSMQLQFENGVLYRNMGPSAQEGWKQNVDLSMVAQYEGETIRLRMNLPYAENDYRWDWMAGVLRGELSLEDTVTPEQVATCVRIMELLHD